MIANSWFSSGLSQLNNFFVSAWMFFPLVLIFWISLIYFMWSCHDMRIAYVFGIICIICKSILSCFHHITLRNEIHLSTFHMWIDLMKKLCVGEKKNLLNAFCCFENAFYKSSKMYQGTSLVNLHFLGGSRIAHSECITMCLVLISLLWYVLKIFPLFRNSI